MRKSCSSGSSRAKTSSAKKSATSRRSPEKASGARDGSADPLMAKQASFSPTIHPSVRAPSRSAVPRSSSGAAPARKAVVSSAPKRRSAVPSSTSSPSARSRASGASSAVRLAITSRRPGPASSENRHSSGQAGEPFSRCTSSR